MIDYGKAGHDLMTRMLGSDFAERLEGMAAGEEFGADFYRLVIDQVFGGAWDRPGLSLRDRSLATIAALAANGSTEELKQHVRFGQNNGLSRDEIKEILLQILPYVGFPRISSAFTTARGVLEV